MTAFPDGPVPHFALWEPPEPGASMQLWQDGRCAMCGASRSVRLVLDHDHDTGMTRGLLCRSCNMLESSTDHPAWLRWRAGLTPARVYGWEEDYYSIFGPPVEWPRRTYTPEEDAALAEAVATLNLDA